MWPPKNARSYARHPNFSVFSIITVFRVKHSILHYIICEQLYRSDLSKGWWTIIYKKGMSKLYLQLFCKWSEQEIPGINLVPTNRWNWSCNILFQIFEMFQTRKWNDRLKYSFFAYNILFWWINLSNVTNQNNSLSASQSLNVSMMCKCMCVCVWCVMRCGVCIKTFNFVWCYKRSRLINVVFFITYHAWHIRLVFYSLRMTFQIQPMKSANFKWDENKRQTIVWLHKVFVFLLESS